MYESYTEDYDFDVMEYYDDEYNTSSSYYYEEFPSPPLEPAPIILGYDEYRRQFISKYLFIRSIFFVCILYL